MNITPHHAKCYAHELTKRCSSDSLEKLAPSLMDAQVDLNPHQVEATLFAFRFEVQDEVESRKERLNADVEARLQQRIQTNELFTIRWQVV